MTDQPICNICQRPIQPGQLAAQDNVGTLDPETGAFVARLTHHAPDDCRPSMPGFGATR